LRHSVVLKSVTFGIADAVYLKASAFVIFFAAVVNNPV